MTAGEKWLASLGFAGSIAIIAGRRWEGLALLAIAAFVFLLLAVMDIVT